MCKASPGNHISSVTRPQFPKHKCKNRKEEKKEKREGGMWASELLKVRESDLAVPSRAV